MSAQLDFHLLESLKTDGPIDALTNKMREEIGKIEAHYAKQLQQAKDRIAELEAALQAAREAAAQK